MATSIKSVLALMLVALSLAWSTTLVIESLISSISLAMFCAFSAEFWASLPISLATTEKPFPASPALAASILALRERRFVSSAISPINATMPVIRSEASPTLLIDVTSSLIEFSIWPIASDNFSISVLPCLDISTDSCIASLAFVELALVTETTSVRVCAFMAISLTAVASSSTVELRFCIAFDCFSEAWYMDLATTSLVLDSSCNLADSSATDCSMFRIILINWFTLSLILPISSLLLLLILIVKSPSAIAVTPSEILEIGLISTVTM